MKNIKINKTGVKKKKKLETRYNGHDKVKCRSFYFYIIIDCYKLKILKHG